MIIKVKYHADITPISYIRTGDWIDLRTAEDVHLKKGEFKLISLGISIQLPYGYEALVIPRSSTYKKYKVLQANSVGLIDNLFKGSNDIWMFPALAVEDTFIPKDTRICQFRIIENQPKLEFVTVDNLNNPDRGGFGSTGEK